ncbi:unnamed protein product [Orchesella dallaii]|uniref:Uncharacterized protein n=1 Tax=Orchesella dallaii TaxID=48710 RepID=A0ABP1R1A6_9HEXA
MRFLVFAYAVLVACVAIDGALSLPVFHRRNEDKLHQIGSTIQNDLHLNPVTQWIPTRNPKPLSTQSDHIVLSNKRSKRSAEEEPFPHFYKRIFMELPAHELDGGNEGKINESVSKDDVSFLSTFPQWIQFPVLMSKLPRNTETVITQSDRLAPTYTRTKRSERESFYDDINKAAKATLNLLRINSDSQGPIIPDSIKNDWPIDQVFRPRIKRSPQESWHHWWYGTVWPVIKGKNTMG